MTSSLRRALLRTALLALPLAFFGIFLAWPVATMIGLGLRDEGEWQWARVAEVLTDPVTRSVAWFTVWQATVSTALTLAIALPGAYIFARKEFAGKRFLRALITVPFVLPTVVVAAAFLALLGRGGVLDSWLGIHAANSIIAIFAAHVFFNYAVVVRVVGSLWSHLDPRQEEAARVLGATRAATWWRITFPQLLPAIAGAGVIVFLFTFTSFGVIQILGGPRYATLEVEIYRQTAQFLNLPTAATLALIQLVAVVTLLVMHSILTQRHRHMLRLVPTAYATERPHGRGARAFVYGNIGFMLLLLVTPLLVLVERSFSSRSGGYTLSYWQALFSHDQHSTLFQPAAWAIANSISYALAATAIALLVGGLASSALAYGAGRFTRTFDAFLMLPLGISAVTVGFGFLVTLDSPPLDLRTSPLLIPLAQALVAIPFVVRTVTPPLHAIDQRLRDAAAVLGASPWRAWRTVDLPIIWRASAVAAGFAFAVSLGEFGATIFLARPDTPTMPVAIFRLLGRPGDVNYGQAMALAVILMILCGGAMLLFERTRLPRAGGL